MRYIGIIPARFQSSRFPGKPLCTIGDKSMIEHVCTQVRKVKRLEKVIVATDHEGIARSVQAFGGEVCMTSANHRSGTERCAEVFRGLLPSFPPEETTVINIQGDEPFIQPAQIEELISCMETHQAGIGTLVLPLTDPSDLSNANVVKVVRDKNGNALYFSRSAIPFMRSATFGEIPFYKHIGMYAYRGDVLLEIVGQPASPIEKAESLEQLGWLYNGFDIATQITRYPTNIAIDTPEDLEKANAYYRQIHPEK